MIPQPDCAAVFHYAYRPLSAEMKHTPDDGGFTLTLFQDNRLVAIHYNGQMLAQQQVTYRLPTEAKMKLLALLDSHEPVLRSLPERMFLPQGMQPRFLSRFGFEGHPFLCTEDIPQLVRLDFGDPVGRAARYLCAFFEDVAELFVPYGVEFYLNGYVVKHEQTPPQDTQSFYPDWDRPVAWTNAANY